MNVVHVPRRFVRSHWGGTETVILQTCRQLVARGHATKIMTPAPLADTMRESIDGVDVERFGYFYPWLGLDAEAKRHFDQKGGNLFSFGLMKALRREPKLDIVHLHTAKRLGGIVRHVARQRRIPYVVSLHGGFLDVPAEEAATWTRPAEGKWEWGKVLGLWVGSRRVFDDAAAILCVGAEEQRRTGAAWPHKKVLHLPNGVDPDRFASGDGAAFRAKHGIPQDACVVFVAGRIDPQKNQELAARILAGLRERVPGAHLLLVGHVTNDDYRRQVETTVRSLSLEGHVTLVPGIAASDPDLANAFHAADAFLLSSIHEPFGIVILEAWAAGLPVVASRVGGVPSFVEDGVDGILVDSGDAAGAIAALDGVLGNRERAKSIADAGCRKAREQYSWARITDRLVTIYEEAVRENPLRQ